MLYPTIVKSSHECDGLKVTLEVASHTIPEVLEAFENVLRGSGYFFNGHLEVVENEEWEKDIEDSETSENSEEEVDNETTIN